MGESVSLSWPMHSRTLMDGLWNLLNDNYRTDFEMSTQNNNVTCRVHQLILAIFCPALVKKAKNNRAKLMLGGGGPDDDFHVEDLKAIVEFLYLGEVTVVADRLDSLLAGALSLGLDSLIEVINQFKIQKTYRNNNNVSQSKARNASSRKRKLRPGKTNRKRPPSSSSPPPLIITVIDEEMEKDIESLNSTAECDKGETDDVETPKLRSADDEKPCEEPKGSRPKRKYVDDSSSGVCTRGKHRRRSCNTSQTEENEQPEFHPVCNHYECELCDKGFASRDRYIRHMRCHQNPEQLQQCPRCDYKTGEKYILIQHMASRHRLDPEGNPLSKDVQCPNCEFRCVSNFQLRNHTFHKHSAKSFKCAECDYSCVKKADHDKHVRAKHRNLRPYLCEQCGYRGKTLSAFKCHMRIHTGERPFVCDVCGQSFSLSGTLRCHQKVHGNEEKPHPCHLCSFSTWKRYNLKVHLKHVHKDLFTNDAICEQVTAEWRDMKHHHQDDKVEQQSISSTLPMERLTGFDTARIPAEDYRPNDIQQFLI